MLENFSILVVDLIILIAAHIAIIILAYPNKSKLKFSIIYLIILVIVCYIGVPKSNIMWFRNIYSPALAIFFFTIFVTAFTIITASFCHNRKPQEMTIVLFPLISLSLFFHYSHSTGIFYLNQQLLRGILGTVAPIIHSILYILAKVIKNKKETVTTILWFFVAFGIYLFNLFANSGILILFPCIWFVLLLVVLGLGLAKKLDYVIG